MPKLCQNYASFVWHNSSCQTKQKSATFKEFGIKYANLAALLCVNVFMCHHVSVACAHILIDPKKVKLMFFWANYG
jgi:hypothetical protein